MITCWCDSLNLLFLSAIYLSMCSFFFWDVCFIFICYPLMLTDQYLCSNKMSADSISTDNTTFSPLTYMYIFMQQLCGVG